MKLKTPAMIDRAQRDRMALALRRFAIGRATQTDLSDITWDAHQSPDAGVNELAEEIYWAFENSGLRLPRPT